MGGLFSREPAPGADPGTKPSQVAPLGENCTVELFTSLATGNRQTKVDTPSFHRLLHGKGVVYKVIDVSSDADELARMRRHSTQRQLPQLHVNGNYIGLFADVERLEETGEFEQLLRNPPAVKVVAPPAADADAAAAGAGAGAERASGAVDDLDDLIDDLNAGST